MILNYARIDLWRWILRIILRSCLGGQRWFISSSVGSVCYVQDIRTKLWCIFQKRSLLVTAVLSNTEWPSSTSITAIVLACELTPWLSSRLRHQLGDWRVREAGLGRYWAVRARHLAGVQAGGQGGEVRHPEDCLWGQPGAVVPPAGAGDGDPGDEHLHLRGEERQPLRGDGEAGL